MGLSTKYCVLRFHPDLKHNKNDENKVVKGAASLLMTTELKNAVTKAL